MKKHKLNLMQVCSFVREHEALNDEFAERCNNAKLTYHNKANGGCRIRNKKVGMRKFNLSKQYIALSIYNEFIAGTFTPTKQVQQLTLF